MANDKTIDETILGGIGNGPISVVFNHLSSIADWARFSGTCRTLRRLGQQTPQGRVIARQVIPVEVLNHPIFSRYPINWVLLDKLTERPERLVMYFQDPSETEWILAALLGLDGAVKELLGDNVGTKMGFNAVKVGHCYAAADHFELWQNWKSEYCPDFSAEDDCEYTYIKLIVSFGRVRMLEHFVEHYGYDIHWSKEAMPGMWRAHNLCTWAAMHDQLAMLKFLIEQKKVDHECGCLRTEAARGGAWESYFYLKNLDIFNKPIDRQNYYRILIAAAGCGQVQVIEDLRLQLNTDLSTVRVDNTTPLSIIASPSEVDKATGIVSPLSCAAALGNIDQIKFILEKKWGSLTARRQRHERPFLHFLILNGHGSLLPQLQQLEPLIDLQAKDDDGNTALHCAAAAGDWDVFCDLEKILVNGGELPLNAFNTSVAQAAAAKGKLKFLIKLVERYGEEILLGMDSSGNTIQHYACRSTNLSLVRWLFERQHYSELTQQNKQLDTPLHLLALSATIYGNTNAWYFIIEMARKFGQSILDISSNKLTVRYYMNQEAGTKHPWISDLLVQLLPDQSENHHNLRVGY